MNVRKLAVVAGGAVALLACLTQAQAQQYGSNITLDQARKAAMASDAEARKNNWAMAIAVMDTGGHLVYLHKMDGTQIASVQIAQDKAASAALYRRSTKVFEDAMAAGGAGLRYLQFPRASATEGGVPLLVDGKVVGGIGLSGGSKEQDGQVAKAGADAIK